VGIKLQEAMQCHGGEVGEVEQALSGAPGRCASEEGNLVLGGKLRYRAAEKRFPRARTSGNNREGMEDRRVEGGSLLGIESDLSCHLGGLRCGVWRCRRP